MLSLSILENTFEMSEIPINRIDILGLRKQRQQSNDLDVSEKLSLLKQGFSEDELSKIYENDTHYKQFLLDRLGSSINKKELDRFLSLCKPLCTNQQFTDKCVDDTLFRMTLSMNISKKSTRQGSMDERYILEQCTPVASKCGFTLTQLNNRDKHPKRGSSDIVSKHEYPQCKQECLKSFDAEITGKKHGYVFHKACFGSGGHQDNVFIEAHEFGEWAEQYGDATMWYIILIDTNLHKKFTSLKDRFEKCLNVFVVNHIQLQELFISNR